MTKPLELTVYPHVMDGGFDCIIDREGTMRIPRECDDFAADKQLTDGYWRAGWIAESERTRQSDQVARTIYRFATLPHASENGYE